MAFGPELSVLTRRRLLAAIAGVPLAMAAACSTPAQPSATATVGKPAAVPTQAPAAQATAASPAAGTAVKAGGQVKFGRASDFTGFDPTNFGTFQEWIPAFYDTLTRQDAALKPQPELAESWEMAKDGLTLTMNLRKGVTFHSGRELEAKDVVASFSRVRDPKTGANIRGMMEPVAGAEAKDRHTVVFKFDKPYAAIFDALDMLFIHPEESTDDLKTKPVGTGPFILGERVPNTKTIVKRNPKYWRSGAPLVDEIEIQILPDAQGRIVALETGSVHVIEQPSYLDFVRLRDDKNYLTATGGEGGSILTVYFNVTRKPFDNKQVRQAISHALDRDRITQTYTRGVSKAQSLPWRKEVFAYDAELEGRFAFNLDKAKQLLAEGGYPNGFEAEINTSGEGYSPGSKMAAEILQADLAKIGVKLTIRDYE
ncbi:MAG: ABC transporter substrate-binding protein, partial [Chloroflexota bacterium]